MGPRIRKGRKLFITTECIIHKKWKENIINVWNGAIYMIEALGITWSHFSGNTAEELENILSIQLIIMPPSHRHILGDTTSYINCKLRTLLSFLSINRLFERLLWNSQPEYAAAILMRSFWRTRHCITFRWSYRERNSHAAMLFPWRF